MRILYYLWEEPNDADGMECLKRMGHEVFSFSYPLKDKLNDIAFAKNIEQILKESVYDCIFTFNFFPIISKVACAYHIKYISWVYDSPHLTLYAKTVFSENNYIFCFDRFEVNRLRAYGVEQIYHMPLAVNTKRLEQVFSKVEEMKYSYEVSFLGNLYNNEYNFFDQIRNMPEYYKGFFDGLIKTQTQIFGCDVAAEVITEALYEKIKTFVAINLEPEMFIREREVFLNFVQRKVTVEERPEILRKISEKYSLSHFAYEKAPTLTQVNFCGYADYMKEMPFVFRGSKINLNITLRSILSGIPLRCMDIMGAGGFLLSNYQPELAEFFRDGQEMVMYESQDDLMGKIEYYLSHEKERKDIAMCGKEKIEKEFSYEKKLSDIFRIVFEE